MNIKKHIFVALIAFLPGYILYGQNNEQTADSLKKQMADALNTQGASFNIRGDYPRALAYFHKFLEIKKELGDKKGMANARNNIGIIYYNQGDYPKALEYYQKALTIYEGLEDKSSKIANTYNNIGAIYYGQNDYPQALRYYHKSLKIQEELADAPDEASAKAGKKGIAEAYHNIGAVYYKQEAYPQALEYYLKSLGIKKELGYKQGIADSYVTIGIIYRQQGDYSKALEYYSNALTTYEELGNKQRMALAYINIGMLHTTFSQTDDAVEYLSKGLDLAKEIGALSEEKYAYEGLTTLYEKQKNYQKAHEYHLLYTQAKDSLFNTEKSKELGKIEASYDYENKMQKQRLQQEKKEALAREHSEKQQIIIWALSVGFGLVLVLAFVILKGYFQKKETNKLLADKNEIIEQKNKDITDSIQYASKIQQAILPKGEEMKGALPEHFVLFRPRDIVSGDFYWVYQKVSRTVYIAACDCTGHGVPGAFVSMVGNDLLNQVIIEKGVEYPSEILSELNRGIHVVFGHKGFEQEIKDGIDMALCRLDLNANSSPNLQFSGAKIPMLLVRSVNNDGHELREIKPDRTQIGGNTGLDYKFTDHKIQLEQGNTFYIFSDGYTDQFGGPKEKKFTMKSFKELLLSIQDKSMKEQSEILQLTINKWMGDTDQIDDILVIGIRV